jgi:hypothetical protein
MRQLNAKIDDVPFQNGPGAKLKFEFFFTLVHWLAALEPNAHFLYQSTSHYK